MRIGVISDTHGLLRPEAEARLMGVRHILHAGDLGAPDIVPRLGAIAPVSAVRGNVDRAAWAAGFPERAVVRLGGRSILLLHDLAELREDPASMGLDAVVTGHSHRPRIERAGGVLHLNPGSAGPRRFRLPVTLATLDLGPEGIEARVHVLRPAR